MNGRVSKCRDRRCSGDRPCDVCFLVAYRVLMVVDWIGKALDWQQPTRNKDKE